MNIFLPHQVVITLSFLIASCNHESPSFSHELSTVKELADHSETFRKRIEKVDDNIYVAIGYGLANSILIVGDEGRIIVDCMESQEAGQAVRAAFDSISKKPVKAIIYTHNHADHVFGAMAIAGDDKPEVYAHESLPEHLDRTVSVVRPILEKRAYRMFGNFLDDDGIVNCGIGPKLQIDKNTKLGTIRPTITFRDSLSVTIAGIRLMLAHAPGETPDQLFVWLPDQKVLLPGDNIYKTFPNLYTIRGTPYRDINLWKESLDKMRYLHPKIIIPSHTVPIQGADECFKILTDYRDAIQFVHDQTVRRMNLGMTPDEIAESVVLPEHLQQSAWLKEFYGKTEWSVRSVFDGYMGFFDGNPTNLLPLTKKDRAGKVEQLAGGKNSLAERIKDAFDDAEYQWVLELTDHYLLLYPDDKQVTGWRLKALTKLGEAQSNPNARHYYLTCALELQGLKNEPLITPSVEMVHNIPLAAIFNGMAVRLNPEKSRNVTKSVLFEFPDTGEKWGVHIRKGVAEVRPFVILKPDLTITVNATIWKELAAKLRKPLPTFISGEIKVDGGQIEFISFMRLFDMDES